MSRFESLQCCSAFPDFRFGDAFKDIIPLSPVNVATLMGERTVVEPTGLNISRSRIYPFIINLKYKPDDNTTIMAVINKGLFGPQIVRFFNQLTNIVLPIDSDSEADRLSYELSFDWLRMTNFRDENHPEFLSHVKRLVQAIGNKDIIKNYFIKQEKPKIVPCLLFNLDGKNRVSWSGKAIPPEVTLSVGKKIDEFSTQNDIFLNLLPEKAVLETIVGMAVPFYLHPEYKSSWDDPMGGVSATPMSVWNHRNVLVKTPFMQNLMTKIKSQI